MRSLFAAAILLLVVAGFTPIPQTHAQGGAEDWQPLLVVARLSAAPYDFRGAGSFRGQGYSSPQGLGSVAWFVETNPSYDEGDVYLAYYQPDRGLLAFRVDTRYVKQVSPPASASGSVAVAYSKYAGSKKLDVWVAVLSGTSLYRCPLASTSGYEEYPAIASYSDGYAVLFYNSSDRDYYLVELSTNCTPVASYRVRDGSIYYRDAAPVAAGSGGGAALFVYRDEGNGLDLYATLVTSTGWSTVSLVSSDGDEAPGRSIAYIPGPGAFLVPYYGDTGTGYALLWLNGSKRIAVYGSGADAPPAAFTYNESLGAFYYVSGETLRLLLIDPAAAAETASLSLSLPGVDASTVYAARLGDYILVAYTNSTGSYAVAASLDGAVVYEERISGPGSRVEGVVAGDTSVAVVVDAVYGALHVFEAVVIATSLSEATTTLYILPGDSAKLLDPSNKNGLAGLLAGAEHSIHAALAFFENMTVAELLVDAKNRGVDVGVVTDDDSLEYEAIRYLTDNGVTVVTDAGYEEAIGENHTMHDKFIVVDGRHVVIGTANPTTTGLGSNYENILVFRNTPLIAAALETEYQDLASGGFGPSDEREALAVEFFINTSSGEPVAATVFTGPEHRLDWELEGLARKAENSIAMAEYIFTTSSTIRHLRAAILEKTRSADVKAVFYWLLNLDTPGRFAYELLEVGGHVAFSRGTRTLHAKTMVVDAAFLATGSYNPTGSATRYNDESIVLVYSSTLASKLQEWIEGLYTQWAQPVWRVDYHPLILAVGLKPAFIQVYNPTKEALNLSTLVVGDSENLYSDDEGLYRFPGGVLEPGESVIVAYNATEFYEYYGFKPDYEVVDSDPAVPDMQAYLPERFTGTLDFNTTGDEAVLGMLSPYDPEFIYMADMIAYGASTALPVETAQPPSTAYPVIARLAPLDSIDHSYTTSLSTGPVREAVSSYAEALAPGEDLETVYGRTSLVVEAVTGVEELVASIYLPATWPETPVVAKYTVTVDVVVKASSGDYRVLLEHRAPYMISPGSVEAYYLAPNGSWKPLEASVNGSRIVVELDPDIVNNTLVALGGTPVIVGGVVEPPPSPTSRDSPQQLMLLVGLAAAAALAALLAVHRKTRTE